MKVEVSNGELIDKMVILRIKSERIENAESVARVRAELEHLEGAVSELPVEPPERLVAELKTVNESLWEIEDDIRRKEACREFDSEFIELARSVYITNDRRAALKRELNVATESCFFEEKSYEEF